MLTLKVLRQIPPTPMIKIVVEFRTTTVSRINSSNGSGKAEGPPRCLYEIGGTVFCSSLPTRPLQPRKQN